MLSVYGKRSGAPICGQTPGHGEKMDTNEYQIVSSAETYVAGETLTMTVSGIGAGVQFKVCVHMMET